ncbi:MAG TPA: hypothetical protein VJB98_02870 [Candidatus Paceibacterota bacterium]
MQKHIQNTALVIAIISVASFALPTIAGAATTDWNPPSCPFNAQVGRTIVRFPTSGKLIANGSPYQTTPEGVSLSAGNYRVSLASYDNHPNAGGTQLREQYFIKFMNGGTLVAQSASIPDLPDNSTTINREVNSSLPLSQSVSSVIAYHSAYPSSGPESILPLCAAFDLLDAGTPPPPTSQTGSLLGRVLHDDNNDRVRNGADAYIRDPQGTSCTNEEVRSGFVISYSGPQSGTLVVNKCNPEPYYSTFLPVGNYNVSISVPSGWQVLGTNSRAVSITSSGFSHEWFYVRPIQSTINPPTVDIKADNSNGPITIDNFTSANLSWASTNADSCTASASPLRSNWTGFKSLNGSQPTGALSTGTYVYTITCDNTAGSDSDSVTVNVRADQVNAPSVTLTANPTSVTSGNRSTLSWTSANATSCYTTSGPWATTGSKSLNSSEQTNLIYQTSTYRITCENSIGQTATDDAVVTVAVDNTIGVTLTASSNSVNQGGSSTLSWTSTNAAYCIADGGITSQWVGDKSVPSGSTLLTNLQTTRTYGITCYNSQGNSAHDDASIAVTQNQITPTVDINASPNPVMSGNSSRLYWNSNNAVSCQTSGGPWVATGSKNLNDNESTGNLYNATAYSITCYSSTGQSASDSVTVNIQSIQQNNPPTLNFYASPSVVPYGNTSTLYWSTTNADYCTASGDWSGNKSVNSSEQTGQIYATRNYIMTCYGPGGSVVRNTTVTPQGQVLGAVPPTLTIYAIPTPVQYGQSSTVYWNSQNTDTCFALGNWFGTKPVSGQYPTGPLFADSTFTMTCYGTGGTITRSAVVPVIMPPVYVPPPSCPVTGCVQGVTGSYSASIEKTIENLSIPGQVGQTVLARPGSELRYTITVRNTGTLTLTNLVVRDPLSDRVEVKEISNSGTYDYRNKTITWKLARLGVGESKTFTLLVKVIPCDCATELGIENRAYVDNSQISEVSSNNTIAGVATGPFEITIDNVTPVVGPGDKVTYTIRYRNATSQSVSGAMLNVYIPSGMIIEGYTETCTIDGNTLTLNLGTVAPLQSGQVQVVGKIDEGVLDGEQLVTRAVVSYRDSQGYTRESSAQTVSTVDRDGNNLASVKDSSDANDSSGLRFLPDTFFGWLLLLLLIIVLAIFVKRLLTKDEPAK